MKHLSLHWGRNLLQAILILMILASCVPQKKIKYLQSLQATDTTNAYLNKRPLDYRIQPGDNLYIRIFSLDEKTYLFFNRVSSSNNDQFTNDASIYLNSYTVDKNGFIDFPIVGRVCVKELNVEQVKEALQKKVDEYLTETLVVVKMVNFKITVLGEVKSPCQLSIYQDEINIFEALAMAGDLTDYANRNKIALVRQTHDGSKVIYLNLNKADIISSEYYYMMPNDIIYASPLGIKQWGFATFPYAIVFSAISTALLLINYFK